jgi:RepB DNA-primase N-terminal domain
MSTSPLVPERATMRQPIEWLVQPARQFLAALDPDAEAFTFQTFDDKKRLVERVGRDGKKRPIDPLAKIVHGSLDAAAPRLTALSQQGAGVYVTINETDLRGRREANVRRVRAVFADLDGAPIGNLARFGLKPSTITCSSPGRFQIFWPVDGVAREEFAMLQRRLARLLDGDPSVIDLPRVMRLPGFPHQKREPFMVMAVHGARCVYSRNEIVAALDEAERSLGLPPMQICAKKSPRSAAGRDRNSVTQRILDTFYHPANAELIASECQQMHRFRDSRGDLDYPWWWRCLGVLRYCQNGREIAHAWSQGDRYDGDAVDRFSDGWENLTGATTCESFAKIGGCDGCPHLGEINSPIALGYPAHGGASAYQPIAANKKARALLRPSPQSIRALRRELGRLA